MREQIFDFFDQTNEFHEILTSNEILANFSNQSFREKILEEIVLLKKFPQPNL